MNCNQLHALIKSLPDLGEAELHTWKHHRKMLRKQILEENISKFINWSTIQATMFVGDGPIANFEYDLLEKQYENDPDTFLGYIHDPELGEPGRMARNPYGTGNAVHQLFHATVWQNITGKYISNLQTIVEFGGGYGTMRALCQRLGFKGHYVMYDLPEFAYLQEYYLSNLGIPTEHCVMDELMRFKPPPDQVDLLIACYSISEADTGLRNAFFDTCKPASCLIAYQNIYFGRSNPQSFREFASRRKEYEWNFIPNPNPSLIEHEYLIGCRHAVL